MTPRPTQNQHQYANLPPTMPVPVPPTNSRNRASHHVQTSTSHQASAPTPTHDPHSNTLNMVGPSHPMPRQRVYFGPYLLLQTLGEGEFGKVKLGVHSSPERWGEEVAIKLIKRGNVDTQARMIKVAREIDVLKLVKHPNIVRLYDVIETEKYIGIVLEYASGGELFDHILAHRYLKEKDASRLFAQLISGVTYLHNKKIVHRDLKLENLLLDRNRNIIITDFGFANRFEDRSSDLMATSCGSPCYAAPELVVQDGRYVGSQVDVWSCGVILYAMLAGYLPFDDDPTNPDGDNINLLYKYIINTPLSFPDWITDQPKDLLLKMLVPDPLKRCSLNDVIKHAWLSKYAHLFNRSIEELELISEENEHQKRLTLQAQRQAMANRTNQPGSVHDQMGRSQTNPTNLSHNRARAHQSAMVVPTISSNADQNSSIVTGAYQQQSRGQMNADNVPPVTHLQPAPVPHQPSSGGTTKSRRTQQAQSAIVVPTTSSVRQNKENEGIMSGMEDIYSGIAADQQQKAALAGNELVYDHDESNTGKKRRVSTKDVTPNNTTQRYTVQVEYSSTHETPTNHKTDSRSKGKGVDRPILSDDQTMIDGDENATPKMHKTQDPRSKNSPKPDDHQQVTPQPKRPSTAGLYANPVINVTHPIGGGHQNDRPTDPVTVPFPSPPLGNKKNAAEAIISSSNSKANRSTVSITPGHHSSLSPGTPSINAAESISSSKKENRHRKGLSTDKFLSRLLGNNHPPTTPTTGSHESVPPLPSNVQPSNKKSNSGSYTSAAVNATRSTRRKALSMVVEPLSGKINNSASNRAQRKSGKVVVVNSTSPTTENGPNSGGRMRRGSALVPGSGSSSQSQVTRSPTARATRRMTLGGAKKESNGGGVKDKSQIGAPVLISSTSSSVGGTNVDDQVNEVESPNWSHHTNLNASQNSIGHLSSSSKAKRVMDWFRFKSLNTSSTSQNQVGNSNRSPHGSDGVIPPVPFVTDFDERRRKGGNEDQDDRSQLTAKVVGTDRSQHSSVSTSRVGPLDEGATASTNDHQSRQPKPQMITSPTTRNPSTVVSPTVQNFSDTKLKIHNGAIDQNAISSISPPLLIREVKRIMWEMGIEWVEENHSMKLKATRKSKKKVVASLGLGVFEALQQQQQQRGTNQHSHNLGVTPSGGGSSGGGVFKSIFQRKPSNASVIVSPSAGSVSSGGGGGVMIDQFGNVEGSNVVGVGNQPLPAYSDDPSVDSGDDVRFTVEITRLRGLNGLYAVDIKRLKGSLWSFKYLYLQILERADLGNNQRTQEQLQGQQPLN